MRTSFIFILLGTILAVILTLIALQVEESYEYGATPTRLEANVPQTEKTQYFQDTENHSYFVK